jgi:hypothetical protein
MDLDLDLLYYQSAFKGKERHKICMMNNICFGGPFHKVTFMRMSSNYMADFGRYTALFRQ